MYVNAEHGSLLDKHPCFTQVWKGGRILRRPYRGPRAIAQQKEYGLDGG